MERLDAPPGELFGVVKVDAGHGDETRSRAWRPCITICMRFMAPNAVASHPASAATSIIAWRMRTDWSITPLASVT